MFFLAHDLFDSVAPFAGGFVDFSSSIVGRVVGDIHGASTTGLHTDHVLMLKGLNEPSMTLSFLR